MLSVEGIAVAIGHNNDTLAAHLVQHVAHKTKHGHARDGLQYERASRTRDIGHQHRHDAAFAGSFA